MTNRDKLLALKERWMQTKKGEGPFFSDGILVEEAWNRARPRIMFLLKECYKSSNWYDVEGKSIKIKRDKPGKFWENILRWKYLITNFIQGKGVIPYPALVDLPEIQTGEILDIAYVNINKLLGNSRSVSKDILKIALKDADFLIEQIDLIQPDIILCGKTFWSYYAIYKKNSQFKRISSHLLLHKHRIIVDFYHPGRPYGNRDKELYDKLTKIFQIDPSLLEDASHD